MKRWIVVFGLWCAPVPVMALDYDPYNEKGQLTQEQADAADPVIIALKKQAMDHYWDCIKHFAPTVNNDMEKSQQLVGPECNEAWMSWLEGQIKGYRLRQKYPKAFAPAPGGLY